MVSKQRKCGITVLEKNDKKSNLRVLNLIIEIICLNHFIRQFFGFN